MIVLQEKDQGFHAIIRALAYKWIRILWKCWQDGVAYHEPTYIERLRQKSSPLTAHPTSQNAA